MLKRQERCGVPFSRTGSAGGDARGKNNGPSPGRLCDARAPASDSEAVSPGPNWTRRFTPLARRSQSPPPAGALELHHAPYSRLTAKTRDVSGLGGEPEPQAQAGAGEARHVAAGAGRSGRAGGRRFLWDNAASELAVS